MNLHLDMLPKLEDVQAILDSMQEWLSDKCWGWYGDYMPSGTACSWLPLNKYWGMKIFRSLDWGENGYEGTIYNAVDAYDLGIGPYVHMQEFRVNFQNKSCPAFFMHRAERVRWCGHVTLQACLEEWRKHGFHDIMEDNTGEIDGKLLLIDTSHRTGVKW